MSLHPDRYSTTSILRKNGVVVHDSEGSEGILPWGQPASAQLAAMLAGKGDRPSPSRPGGVYGSGYHAIACEDGTYLTLAGANAAPYHAPPCNPTMWSICIPGRAAQTRDQWLNDVSRQYIRGVARYIVDRWNDDGHVWPLEFQSSAELIHDGANAAGRPSGYTAHSQVSNAWHQTDHTDPGVAFPWDVLAADIAQFAGQKPPTPDTPQPPSTTPGDAMFLIKDATGPSVYLVIPAAGIPQKRARVHITAEQFDTWNAAYGPLCTVGNTASYGPIVGS